MIEKVKRIGIQCKVLSPLAQIDPAQSSSANSKNQLIVETRKMKILYDTGNKDIDGNPLNVVVKIPIYSANGFRGLLRRKAAEIIAQAAINKGLTLTRSNFHLFFAGGGNNFPSCGYAAANDVRRLNPLVSLFGAGLAIEGNLIVSDLIPANYMIREYSKDGTLFAISDVIGKSTYSAKDDILAQSEYVRFLSEDDVNEWTSSIKNEGITRKEEKAENKPDNERTKRTAIQSIYTKEFIIPGTLLMGSIDVKHDMTDLEQGLLLKALHALAYEQLGSSKNIGWGYTEYAILNKNAESDRDIIIESGRNPKLLADITVSDISKEYTNSVKKWLSDIKQENISIAEIIKN